MSAPVSPTLVKRKAKRAVSARTRKSEASASTAPAPAATPLTDATTGFSSRRRLRTTAPVMRVNCSMPLTSRFPSSPMISWTSPPEQKPLPDPVRTSTRTASSDWHSIASRSSSA